MRKIKLILTLLFLFSALLSSAQQWQNVDSLYSPLPPSVHVYFTDQAIDTSPFRAFYVIADIHDSNLHFTTDTTLGRRLTPQQYFEKNSHPLVVVNGTFFSFETNRNLNVVITEGKLTSHNLKTVKLKTGDSTVVKEIYRSAIGLNHKRKPDVAWIETDSTRKYAFASQEPVNEDNKRKLVPWLMQTAIGGGPVLIQDGEIRITNNEEFRFAGDAIYDKHPRTAMGYTADNKLILLVIEGRNPLAGGANLLQEAQILKDLGCIEALNLDGGGSSCLLVNGKETITPAGKGVQRAVPAVFMINY